MAHAQQQEIPLYDGAIPNSKPAPDRETTDPKIHWSLSLVSHPTLKIFLPEKSKATGTAVVVCPGGGYVHLAMGHEGVEIADSLNAIGIAAFVVKYRLPSDETMIDKTIGPLQDAQRAIQLVRQHAQEWGVDPTRVGILGFSAGGHLASSASTHADAGKADAADPIDRASSRPDFTVLAYPVISMVEAFTHKGSRENLLGVDPDPELARSLSSETQVTASTPPAFLFHTNADTSVPAENAVAYFLALRKAGVTAELHVFRNGPHGVGLAQEDPALAEWPRLLANWLRVSGFLK